MKEVWFYKLGAISAILNSFILFAQGIVFIAFIPQAVNIGEFLRVFSHNPFWIQLFNGLSALGGFLGFFIVAATYSFFKKENEALAPLMLILGVVWSFSQAAHSIWDALKTPVLASVYSLGNEAVRAQVAQIASLPNPVDPKGFGTFFVFGLWVFILGLLIFLSKKRAQKYLFYLSIIVALLAWALFFGQVFLFSPILAIIIPLFSLIIGPLFWLTFGFFLWPKGILRPQSKLKSDPS